jgi:hypothetical protein
LERTTACIHLQDPTTWRGHLPVSRCGILLFGQDNYLYPAAVSNYLDRTPACIQPRDCYLGRIPACIQIQDHTTWTGHLPVPRCLDRTTACIQLQDPTTWTGHLPVSNCARSCCLTEHLPVASCRILPLGQDKCLNPAE